MTNVEALKEVYIALGGSAEDFTATTNDQAIALIASVAGGGGSGMTVIEMDMGTEDAPTPPSILNGANVRTLITSGAPIVFYAPNGENAYMYAYPGMLTGTTLYLLSVQPGSTPSAVVMPFTSDSESDTWVMHV